jgi:hypothetical protein
MTLRLGILTEAFHSLQFFKVEGLGTHIPLHETVQEQVNVINMRLERAADSPAVVCQ